MAKSSAATPEEYLAELPAERAEALAEVREVILANLPDGYEEVMEWGMITYVVPLSVHPDTYNKKPLQYAALSSQKNYMAVYLSRPYVDEANAMAFRERYEATGKKLDMGKSCVRFTSLDKLPLDVIGEEIASTPVDEFVELYESGRSTLR